MYCLQRTLKIFNLDDRILVDPQHWKFGNEWSGQ